MSTSRLVQNFLINNLFCSICAKALVLGKDNYYCPSCHNEYLIEGNCLINKKLNLPNQDLINRKSWDNYYKKNSKSLSLSKNNYYANEYVLLRKQIEQAREVKDSIFLELGCGEMFFGQKIAPECQLVIGVDYSLEAIKTAEQLLNEKKIKNYILILEDIRHIPLKNNSVDIIFGGGVIEHFKNTRESVNEIYRLLRPGGISFNTVPALNLGSLTYRQLWGNVPNVSIIKEIFEFIHIKVLKAKHMRYGYEMSFLASTIANIHSQAGFRKVIVDKYEVPLVLEYIPKKLKPLFSRIINEVGFLNPMHKVIGIKL